MQPGKFNIQFINISKDESGQRIDNFLCRKFKGVPKSMIYRILRTGEIRVNKKRVKAEYKIQTFDKVRIPPLRYSHEKKIPFSVKLNKISALNNSVIYEDDYILILNKLTGIAVHGGSGLHFGVIEGLRTLRPHTNFLELVHRLDKDTSGVLLIAKKRSALHLLHKQLRDKEMKKDYVALVRGQWPNTLRSISAPLLKKKLYNGKHIVQVHNEGKQAKTYFQIKERFTSATLLSVHPITGRTHQIRLHTQYSGHPIAFDNLYGDDTFNKTLKNCGLNRIFLHAAAISFFHPANGEIFRIEAPLDSSLHQCLIYLRKN
ncbi:pseudouridine synthase, RluA family [secondary endosymbiont of Heteropsylla cubana]|uniref:Pseudouridine synthase n=1 Tax=secondary endosymbiont of Heteropsylla cubana TaxID=134287 RepID=J3YT03_9ENTR|nr:23S rRNA pseudouridine(955/2504/2580) synthase RluC [secondary endosymbiont of Heteropsylla cubana]AFP85493.1 pseudouridine synthase, RluA family [secondary endosymbiont of Heteropsylla cubana]